MFGTLFRVALISGIIALVVPFHAQINKHLPHTPVTQSISEEHLSRADIIAGVDEQPVRAVPSYRFSPLEASVKSLHLDTLHLNFKQPNAAQKKALLKLALEVQTPEILQRDLAKRFRVAVGQRGWAPTLRHGLGITIAALDGMRKMLVSSEKNLH